MAIETYVPGVGYVVDYGSVDAAREALDAYYKEGLTYQTSTGDTYNYQAPVGTWSNTTPEQIMQNGEFIGNAPDVPKYLADPKGYYDFTPSVEPDGAYGTQPSNPPHNIPYTPPGVSPGLSPGLLNPPHNIPYLSDKGGVLNTGFGSGWSKLVGGFADFFTNRDGQNVNPFDFSLFKGVNNDLLILFLILTMNNRR